MWTSRLLTLLVAVVVDYLHFGLCLNQEQCRPQQTHISYGNSTEEIVIMWSTRNHCSTLVKYGTGPFTLKSSKTGEMRLLNYASNTSALNVVHNVVLTDLKPGTMYFYTPVSNGTSSGPYFFETPQNQHEEIQLMVFSDVSTSSPTINSLVDEALSGKYSALLHLGNIAMNLSSENGENGDYYMMMMEQAVRTVPYLTAPGPSEVEEQTFLNYLFRFSISHEWPKKPDKMWYSINIGPVHLISYSTEVFYSDNVEYVKLQHNWLIEDLNLADSNRQNVPWIIAFGHRPMYCTSEDPSFACNPKITKTSSEKSELEDIFYFYGVDVIIQSHGRAYERSYPMYKGVQITDNYTNPLGPVHIVSGGASPWTQDHNFTTPPPAWSAFRYTNDSLPTYGRLQIINASMLVYEQVSLTDNSVIDSFNIYQEKHGHFLTSKLPGNKSAEIDKERIDAGEKPGILNIEKIGVEDSKSRLADLLNGDNKTRFIIGVSCAVFVAIAIIIIIFVKVVKRKKKVTRRWEQMDINYGKKFYSKAPEKDEDNDFEIDMSDGTEPARKLLTADD